MVVGENTQQRQKVVKGGGFCFFGKLYTALLEATGFKLFLMIYKKTALKRFIKQKR